MYTVLYTVKPARILIPGKLRQISTYEWKLGYCTWYLYSYPVLCVPVYLWCMYRVPVVPSYRHQYLYRYQVRYLVQVLDVPVPGVPVPSTGTRYLVVQEDVLRLLASWREVLMIAGRRSSQPYAKKAKRLTRTQFQVSSFKFQVSSFKFQF